MECVIFPQAISSTHAEEQQQDGLKDFIQVNMVRSANDGFMALDISPFASVASACLGRLMNDNPLRGQASGERSGKEGLLLYELCETSWKICYHVVE